MADVTVKQLASTVGASVERLLSQMQEAGLSHKSEDDSVSEEQKQVLLGFLKSSHGAAPKPAEKITLKRKSTGTLKSGQGRSGRNVTVEVRRKRTYVKRSELETEAPAAPAESQAEIEAQRIREEEVARQEAEGKAREEEAQRKAEAERKEQEEEERKRQEEEREAQEKAVAEAEAARLAQLEDQKTKTPEPAPVANQAELEAREQSEQRSGKRGRGRERAAPTGGENKGKRRELSLKSERRAKKRAPQHRDAPLKLDQVGGEFKPTEFISREVEVGEVISVGDLAQGMAVKAGEVIKTLMGLGVMATINQTIDQDTATLVVEEMGHRIKLVSDDVLEEKLEASLLIEGDTSPRAPVVTVMGHVDHGKTSLLDYIRNTRVTSGEAGGITQHIGAYSVETANGTITFIDTPGHAAFTSMRARGAKVTDIVILVVAADDGVMPQTEEAIQHAKAAEVPIIVAINKIDLENSDPDKVTNELASKDVVPEAWGGDTQFMKVSAMTGEGMDELLEAISLQAELMELVAIAQAPAQGVVIESRLDRGRGPVATILVQNGCLNQSDVIIAGEFHGKVRAMIDDKGNNTKTAGPSQPVEVLGLSGTPAAGDDFSAVTDERSARDLAEFRRDKNQERVQGMQQAARLENMFANIGEGEKRILKLIIKADVRGSLEAIIQSMAEMGNDEVSVQVLGSGVGGISESDATMAITYGAVVFGFNVRADKRAKSLLEKEGVDLRYYSVIYELIDDVRTVLSGMLSPEIREEIVGIAEVRDVFRSPRFGQVAGCMVTEGAVFRNKPIRVLRDNVVIYEGELESLRRFKDDVNEVRNGTECGIGVRNYNDVREGDLIEVFDTKEIARQL
ncbi:MAG TPA: translation initiation factor IF-2 [Gammaproteobacteria bacterium]|nr:translation initiation factor IF-2 [Gammaproteobacteria bacterium]|tara:strand:- start:525 stop:3083 length:2559 start_codon:yes stop_codon:yes gene_type:complete